MRVIRVTTISTGFVKVFDEYHLVASLVVHELVSDRADQHKPEPSGA
jgi:hypothetical protein